MTTLLSQTKLNGNMKQPQLYLGLTKKLLSKPPHPMQLNGSPQDPQMNIMIIISLISYCSAQLQLQIELRLALIS